MGGGTAAFSVTATGTDLEYQWQENGADISGATSAAYTKSSVPVAADDNSYRCIVSNSAGSDTSDAASLTVAKDWIIGLAVGESGFLGSFTDLEGGSIDNSNSFEHIGLMRSFVYDDIVLAAEHSMGDNLYKYTLDSDNNLSQAGTMTLPQGSYVATLCFASKTKAYASMTGLGQVRVFNPTTLQTITDIDLTGYAVGEGDNNPEPGDMVVRDGKLFIALSQATVIMPPVVHDSCWCAVIDVATNTVDKIIVSDKASELAFAGHTNPFVDENNDLYIYAIGAFGYQAGVKEGFLRIKSGETEFDDSYYFSLDDVGIPGVPDVGMTYVMKIAYAGNGVLYALPFVPAWTSDPPDYLTDRNYQPCKINIWNKTIEKLDLPPTPGYCAMGIEKAGDLIVFGLATANNGTGLFTYNHVTGESSTSPVVTTQGMPGEFFYLGN
jgi:hypothetical protein